MKVYYKHYRTLAYSFTLLQYISIFRPVFTGWPKKSKPLSRIIIKSY